MKSLSAAQRVIVSIDTIFDKIVSANPEHWKAKMARLISLLTVYPDGKEQRAPERVHIMLGSFLPLCGYEVIEWVQRHGMCCCADLRLSGGAERLRTDGALLRLFRPEIVTVMTSESLETLRTLKQSLHPSTELLGVPLSASVENCQRAAHVVEKAGLDGILCPAESAGVVRRIFGESDFTVNASFVEPGCGVDPVLEIKGGASRVVLDVEYFIGGPSGVILQRLLREIESLTQKV